MCHSFWQVKITPALAADQGLAPEELRSAVLLCSTQGRGNGKRTLIPAGNLKGLVELANGKNYDAVLAQGQHDRDVPRVCGDANAYDFWRSASAR